MIIKILYLFTVQCTENENYEINKSINPNINNNYLAETFETDLNVSTNLKTNHKEPINSAEKQLDPKDRFYKTPTINNLDKIVDENTNYSLLETIEEVDEVESEVDEVESVEYEIKSEEDDNEFMKDHKKSEENDQKSKEDISISDEGNHKSVEDDGKSGEENKKSGADYAKSGEDNDKIMLDYDSNGRYIKYESNDDVCLLYGDSNLTDILNNGENGDDKHTDGNHIHFPKNEDDIDKNVIDETQKHENIICNNKNTNLCTVSISNEKNVENERRVTTEIKKYKQSSKITDQCNTSAQDEQHIKIKNDCSYLSRLRKRISVKTVVVLCLIVLFILFISCFLIYYKKHV